jgi:hypothetical protein
MLGFFLGFSRVFPLAVKKNRADNDRSFMFYVFKNEQIERPGGNIQWEWTC